MDPLYETLVVVDFWQYICWAWSIELREVWLCKGFDMHELCLVHLASTCLQAHNLA